VRDVVPLWPTPRSPAPHRFRQAADGRVRQPYVDASRDIVIVRFRLRVPLSRLHRTVRQADDHVVRPARATSVRMFRLPDWPPGLADAPAVAVTLR